MNTNETFSCFIKMRKVNQAKSLDKKNSSKRLRGVIKKILLGT